MTSKRRKLIIEKDRLNKQNEQELIDQKKKKEFDQKFVHTKFARTKRTGDIKPIRLYGNSSAELNLSRVQGWTEAKNLDMVPRSRTDRKETDPLMQIREEQAKEQFKIMQTRIAPAYNKGPDIYVSDGMLDDYKNGRTKRR